MKFYFINYNVKDFRNIDANRKAADESAAFLRKKI